MSQQIIIAEQSRIAALLTDDRVDELIVAQGQYQIGDIFLGCLLYTSPSPRDCDRSRMPSSA